MPMTQEERDAEDAKWAAGAADRAAKKAAAVDAQIRTALQEEADPLYFKWQRGETTEQVWLDKVAEVKARFS